MKKDFKTRLIKEGYAPRTVNFYNETAHAVERILIDGGRETDPKKIDRTDFQYLLDYLKAKDYAFQTRKGYIGSLKLYCRLYGNPSVSDWPKARLPPDKRPKVDWLTPDQVRELLSAELDPLQRLVVHLELCLGLRHVEVIRLRTSDIDLNKRLLRIRGKGPAGGKPRTVPYTVGTSQVIEGWEAVRDEMIRKCRQRCPISATVPEELIIWTKAGHLYAYSEEGYGLDKRVCLPLSKKLGFHFSNHTLRRTFGRMLYRSGIQIETIATILGHESTDITLRYIGIDLDDMRSALDGFDMGAIH